MKKSNKRHITKRRKRTASEVSVARTNLAKREIMKEERNKKELIAGLNAQYESCTRTLTEIRGIPSILRDTELMNHIVDKADFRKACTALAQDMTAFSDRLLQIRKLHDREFDLDDQDDYLAMFEINDHYREWVSSYNDVMLPIINIVITAISEARAKLEEKKKEMNNHE